MSVYNDPLYIHIKMYHNELVYYIIVYILMYIVYICTACSHWIIFSKTVYIYIRICNKEDNKPSRHHIRVLHTQYNIETYIIRRNLMMKKGNKFFYYVNPARAFSLSRRLQTQRKKTHTSQLNSQCLAVWPRYIHTHLKILIYMTLRIFYIYMYLYEGRLILL